MVDYSKWDNFGADEEDDEETFQRPRVTTFEGEKGRSFVIGPSGASLVKASDTRPIILPSNSPVEVELDRTNGGITDNFTWSQDRYEVCLRRAVQSELKATNVHIDFNPVDNFLSVRDSSTGATFFEGVLRYKFEINEQELCPIQWELVTIGSHPSSSSSTRRDQRVLEIVLRKVSPIPGSIIWWKMVFIGDPEIDVTTIAGRGKVSTEISSAWDEAHKLFREKIACRELVSVDIDEDDEKIEER
jgi:hypothetical protein